MNDNPLKAYFRRPSMYFKLPSEGKYYPPGVVDIPPNGELPIYPMTTMDEMTIRTPDGLYNGDSVVRVIKNCVPAILDPWKLNDIDVEAIIVAIRAASVDGKLEIESECPSCKDTATYDIDLMRLLSEKRNVDYSTPLEIKELIIKFRPLTYAETNANAMKQLEIQRMVVALEEYEDGEEKQRMIADGFKKLSDMMNSIVSQTIESITTPETTVVEPEFIYEFMTECDGKTSAIIKEHSAKLRLTNDTPPLKMKCIHCQHDYEQALVLNFSNFFA
jgi:hypothetical protein